MSKRALPREYAKHAEIFDSLSEPLRIDMIAQIASVDELPCTVLDETLPVSKSTISYHVKILYHAELIKVRKEGRYYFYKLQPDTFERYLPGFLDRLAKAQPARDRSSVASRVAKSPMHVRRSAAAAAS
jgi:DNA-binding transcriptional ArsR family regulator